MNFLTRKVGGYSLWPCIIKMLRSKPVAHPEATPGLSLQRLLSTVRESSGGSILQAWEKSSRVGTVDQTMRRL